MSQESVRMHRGKLREGDLTGLRELRGHDLG
jgi:hypothetical protein